MNLSLRRAVYLLGRARIPVHWVAEGDEVAIGSEYKQFALAVGLVDGPVNVGFG
jgi:hypothetical protein